MNNIEYIENIYRPYYNKPVLREACGPIFTSSPKEYGQYLQKKNTKENEQSNSNGTHSKDSNRC